MPQGYDGVIVANVHMKPLAVKRGVLDGIHALVEAHPLCAPFLFGDWNFAHPGDPRVDLRRLGEVGVRKPPADYFERQLAAFVKLEQSSPTHRQMSDGVAVLLGRIDRVHTRISPVDFADLCVRVQVLGDIMRPSNASDHLLVSARVSHRCRRHLELLLPLSAAICRTEIFASSCQALMATIPHAMVPVSRSSTASRARSAPRRSAHLWRCLTRRRPSTWRSR